MTKNRSRTKTTKLNIIFQYVSILLMIMSGVVLVPIYLRHIPVNIYGAWLATGNILTWLTVIDPGISAVLQQRVAVAYGQDDIDEVSELITGGILFAFMVAVIVLILSLILSFFLYMWISTEQNVDLNLIKDCFLIASIGSSLMIFSYSLTSINQGLQSSLAIGTVYILVTAFSLFITVVLLKMDYGLYSLAFAPLFSGLGLALGNFIYLMRRLKLEKIPFSYKLTGFNKLLKLMSFAFLGKMGNVISTNMDLFIVAKYLGPESVAMLNFSRKGPDMARGFIERPVIAMQPTLANLRGSGDHLKEKVIIMRILYLLLWLIGWVGTAFVLFNDDFITLWVGSQFYIGPLLSILICLNFILSSLTAGLSNLSFALGNIKRNSMINFYQSILTIILFLLLPRYFGLTGVVLAPVISLLILSSWIYPKMIFKLLNLNKAEINTYIMQLLIVIGVSVLTFLVFGNLEISTLFAFISMISLFSCTYFLVLFFTSTSFRREIRNALSGIQNKI